MINISSIKHLAFILKCKTSENELLSICNSLIDSQHVYDKFFYGEIKIHNEKNGKIKTRTINPSRGRLKLIQDRIKKNILDSIEFPSYVQGANKGYSNITNAKLHLGKKYKFTTDLKKFFPSISPIHVYRSLCEYGFKPDVARVITILCTFKGKLPQGASTSAHIANVAFISIDKWIYEFCKTKGITYSRYIDDVTLSSHEDFKSEVTNVIEKIKENGFSISSPKTGYKHIMDITGISVKNNSMKPNKKFFDKLLNTPINDASKKGMLEYLSRVTQA